MQEKNLVDQPQSIIQAEVTSVMVLSEIMGCLKGIIESAFILPH
jgi:hypothetical protein